MTSSTRTRSLLWLASAALAATVGYSTTRGGAALAQPTTPTPTAQRSPTTPTTPAAAEADDGAPAEHSEADEARRAGVYAQVGDVRITIGMIEDRLAAMQPFLRQRYRDPEKLRQFADDMVRFELMAREAERRGYDERPQVVRTLKQNAVQLLIRREFDERITPETVTEEQVRAYYEAHADEFSRAEMRRASHIRVATREEAQALRAELLAGGADTFRQLARSRSLDEQTKLRGGDLRFFTAEGRPPGSRDLPVDERLVRATFSLEHLGDLSEPVELPGGFSIVKLTGKRPAETRTLEQASRGIRLRLWREQRQSAIDSFVDRLRAQGHPEVHPELATPIHLDPVEPRPGFGGHGEAANTDMAHGMAERPAANGVATPTMGASEMGATAP